MRFWFVHVTPLKMHVEQHSVQECTLFMQEVRLASDAARCSVVSGACNPTWLLRSCIQHWWCCSHHHHTLS